MDSGLVGSTEGYRESSRDTYPESYITKQRFPCTQWISFTADLTHATAALYLAFGV